MAWIGASSDSGYYVGPTVNLAGSTLATSAGGVWIWKSLLKTAGWYVAASWTLGMPTGTLNDVHTGSAVNGWFIITQPNTSRSFAVSGSNNLFKVSYSYLGYDISRIPFLTGALGPPSTSISASFVIPSYGGFVSGASILAARVRGEMPVVGYGFNFVPANMFAGLLNVTQSWVQMLAETSEPYRFWVATYPTGGAEPLRAETGFFLDSMVTGSYDPRDPDPTVLYWQRRETAGPCIPWDPINLQNSQPTLESAPENTAAGKTLANSLTREHWFGTAGVAGWSWATDVTTDRFAVVPPSVERNSRGVNRSVYDGQMELFSIPWSLGRAYSTTDTLTFNGSMGSKGASSLLYAAGTILSMSQGTTLDVATSGAKDYILIGSYALPWIGIDASSSLIQSIPAAVRYSQIMWVTASNSSWFDGSYGQEQPFTSWFPRTIIKPDILYRGVSSSQYVFTLNTPPTGATNIVILS